jgi:hypothetical protein
MTTLPMPNPVDAPEVAEPKAGLVPVARELDRVHEISDQDFGLGGITYRPETVDGAQARSNSTDNAGTDVNRSPNEDRKSNGLVTGYPIVLTVDETCTTFGWKQADYEGRANRRLIALGGKALEWEFWTGEVAKADGLDPAIYQWLAQDRVAESGGVPAHGAVDLTPAGGALDPRHALAELEEALGESGTGVGVIHMSRRMAILMPDRWTEGPMITWPDSAVAVGAGYPGVGPDGAPPSPGEEWVYATNLVDIWLGETHLFPNTLAEALDRGKNTISYKAERLGAVTWDGNAHFAIRVQI